MILVDLVSLQKKPVVSLVSSFPLAIAQLAAPRKSGKKGGAILQARGGLA